MSAMLTDLDDAAAGLVAAALLVQEAAGAAGRLGVDPVLLAAVTTIATGHPAAALGAARLAADVEALGVAAAARLGLEAVDVGLLGGAVLGAVRAYRAAESTETAALADIQDLVMRGAGVGAPVLLLGIAGVGGLQAAGVDVAGAADHTAFDHPWLVDLVGGGLDGFLTGLATHRWGALVLGVAAARAGVRWPPETASQATAVLEQVAALAGLLDEDQAYESSAVDAGVPVAGEGAHGVADLVEGEVALGADDDPGRVRVVEVPQPDGSSAWVLELPGTQAWDPRPATDPFDLSADVEAMAGEATLAAAGAAAALDAAQSRAGRANARDPVMLVGHSQGGILAAAMACDDEFRSAHPVSAVVTMGSPVAYFPIPASVSVLSLEHVQDPVTRLDGARNPDTPRWTTARRDLADGSHSAAGSHPATLYAETGRAVDGAVAAGWSVSLTAWRTDAEPFLRADPRAPVRVTDFHLRRVAGAR